ncbi:MAG TPA: phage holin family protein [Puia sp.]|nr:phage holin family protein [Puia sp.]
MDDFKKVEDLVDHVKEYVHVRVDEARLGLAERASGAIASLIAVAILAGILGIAFVFVFIAGAILVSYLVNDFILGFTLVAVFLTIVGLCIWWGRQRLIRIPIMNIILEEMLKNKEQNKDHEKN